MEHRFDLGDEGLQVLATCCAWDQPQWSPAVMTGTTRHTRARQFPQLIGLQWSPVVTTGATRSVPSFVAASVRCRNGAPS